MTTPPFSSAFHEELTRLLTLRRDVRHFRTDPVPEDLLQQCLATLPLAPSVGLSEPWRVIRVGSAEARAAVQTNFETANATALAGYSGVDSEAYANLKLAGLQEAPVHLAFFSDETTPKGRNLGTATMPEMRAYSVACAIMQLWLVTRAHGLGLGWVSILDADRLCRELSVSEDWRLIAYLCLGWPRDEDTRPELERLGWERRGTTMVQTR